MVRKGAAARRSSKHGSQISAFKRLSLLDPAAPEPPLLQTDESPARPDQVFLHAAAIFQSTHLEKPASQRLISYGSRSEVSVPAARGEASQRLAYQLAFNTLKYQELLEDVLIDSCFCVSQPMPDGGMSLVAVMLMDLMDRKFVPRSQPANQEEEEEAVREVEACLLRFRTKLVASLARCRIKHDLLTLDNILPENIRHRQERATHLPLYAWINTLRSSLEEVTEVLHTSGFSCVQSEGRLEGRSFSTDTHCPDLLLFPRGLRRELAHTHLLSDHRLVLQDKSVCVGPWALRPLLAGGGDVLLSGCFSARTVAHVSAVAASAHTLAPTHTPAQSNTRGQSTVIVCLGDEPQPQTDELQNTLSKLGCKNVRLLSASLESLAVSDVRLRDVRVALVMPACSLSAVSNPVDYIMQENRDPRLMLDLSHGSVSPEKLQTLASQQRKDLQRVVQFPQVRAVLYSTCSVHSEENEEVLKTILSQPATPYRLSSPGLLQDSITEDEDESQEKASFFRLEASDQHNGCFLALLTRQPEPEVMETPQEVLTRAAAKGLLDGLYPNQPIKKRGRGRRSRRAPASQAKTRPHNTQSDQSRVAEFLNHEMRGSSSAPAVCHQSGGRTQSPLHYDNPSSSRRLSQGMFSRTGSTPNHTCPTPSPRGSTPNHTCPTPSPRGSTPNHTCPTPSHIGSTPNHTCPTHSPKGSTPNTTCPASSPRGSTPNHTCPAHIPRGPSHRGPTHNTTCPTPSYIGSTPNTTCPASSHIGSTPNTTCPAPSPTSFIRVYCNSLTESAHDDRSSLPVAPPKGRQEVLRPTTVMFPPVLLSSDHFVPQRRSQASVNPAHTHLQWSNSTPALARAQTVFRAGPNQRRL